MVRQFTSVIPANTAKSSPVTIKLNTGYWSIESIDLEVPAGPEGLMGFQLWIGGGQWIPYEAGEYVVWDDVADSWSMNDQPPGQQWSVVGYNLDGVNGHQVVVRFHIDPVSTPEPPTPTLTIVSQPIDSSVVLA